MKKLKSERPDILCEMFKLGVAGLTEFHPCSIEFSYCMGCIEAYQSMANYKADREEEDEDECEDEACNS